MKRGVVLLAVFLILWTVILPGSAWAREGWHDGSNLDPVRRDRVFPTSGICVTYHLRAAAGVLFAVHDLR